VVEIPDLPERIREIPKVNAIGVDLGLTDFAVTSNDEIFENPKFLKKKSRRLKIRQRKLSRTKRASKNKLKKQLQVRTIHRQVKDTRKDYHYKIANKLVKTYDLICLETLSTKQLMKTKLAKSIQDAGWSQFISIIKWVADKHGKTVVQINRFEPSTKTCNRCGNKQDITLSERTYRCSDCSHVNPRDHNAAMNIRDWGYAKYTTGTVEIYDQQVFVHKSKTTRFSKTDSEVKLIRQDLAGKSSEIERNRDLGSR
jgi:putative transposase